MAGYMRIGMSAEWDGVGKRVRKGERKEGEGAGRKHGSC